MPVPEGGLLDIEFDFIAHELRFRHTSGQVEAMKLGLQSMASFFSTYQQTLKHLGVQVQIDPLPVELVRPGALSPRHPVQELRC